MTIDMGGVGGNKNQAAFTTRDSPKGGAAGGRRAQSLPRARGANSAWTTTRSKAGGHRAKGGLNETKKTFGIIPTYESNMLLNRAAWVKKLKERNTQNSEAYRFA